MWRGGVQRGRLCRSGVRRGAEGWSAEGAEGCGGMWRCAEGCRGV